MKFEQRLQEKITFGYVVMFIIGISMVSILVHERKRIREIEADTETIRQVRRVISDTHQRITRLALLGEGVVGWDETDYHHYHTQLLRTDSLLQAMKPLCREYVRPAQIDTLRSLLADKETQLRHIMQAMERQEEADSLLVNHLPEVARRATRVRTIKQKKNGLAGFFGGKKTVQVLPSARELHAFSDSLTAMQQRQAAEMKAYADSLRIRNRTLNRELERLIRDLDTQAQTAFGHRERKIAEAQALSVRLFTITISAAIVLLFLSYLAIHREMKRSGNERKKRESLITELQKSNDTNEKLIKLRRNLIQNVTHELRTPLTVIGGNAELLLNDTEADNRMRHAQTIGDAVGRMAGMINNLLVYFRLDSGKETPSVKPFKLRSIAETLETEFATLAKNKGLNFKTASETDEIVSGDRNRIISIGGNLLSNAIKFTRSGTVTLSTGYKNGIFTLTVEDTGTGMTGEQQARIFIPFERLGNAVTEDGFGLGLAIVADTVKLLKGNITVESEPGKGSRFTVSLPLAKAEEMAAAEKTNVGHSTLSDCSVLAIDNNGMLLDMMKEMYRQNGVDCDTCQTAGELTDLMRTKDYDLLITDLKMPEVNGYEVLELLRTSEIGNSQTIPVVAATAGGYVEKEELTGKGFAAVLYKPYSIDELLAVTESCIKRNKANSIDLSSLLAFGDKRRTLEKLAATTQSDMDEVRKAAEAGDMEALDYWVHHLRSSWMLIKAEQPLAALYEAIHKEDIPDEKVQSAVNAVLAQCRLIVDSARKEAERWDG
ncbi:hybrid sensor histidine kinase/response regulator [Mediterranea sp. An20]|uniref:hybrid sensor histidine kinase/response regulator n=1 Tax=Bacteroidaceae TaxID=815 RepID=UPI000B54EBA8|nr:MULTISPECIES: hybrid sensor histidine kinase/response regulator [Bacteroidaceae]OUN80583.1 hybrid sensor histidine kinase/response regulator [Bacteroides sp. An51A]OUP05985.1 hybrid sensor histidine kinase/response regulator [Mediterranea sp. An20]OUP35109.1 hybrid sensor histidine kinase/response regulator [Bacteroides sp. An19]